MEVINDFPYLDKLTSENQDIAFFAKMDLTGALLKAVAEAQEDIKYPPKIVTNKIQSPLPNNKYFFSVQHETLFVADEDTIWCKEPGIKAWENVTEIYDNWHELYKCKDVIHIDYTAYLDKLGGWQTAPNDIPF